VIGVNSALLLRMVNVSQVWSDSNHSARRKALATPAILIAIALAWLAPAVMATAWRLPWAQAPSSLASHAPLDSSSRIAVLTTGLSSKTNDAGNLTKPFPFGLGGLILRRLASVVKGYHVVHERDWTLPDGC